MRLRILPMFVALFFSLAAAQQPTPDTSKPEASKVEVPKLDAAIGACTADFSVKDTAGKPVYNAKIHTIVRYGTFAVRKTELEVSTNYEGQARIIGLPDVNKRPTQFDVSKDSAKAVVAFDPGADCHPHYEVTLK